MSVKHNSAMAILVVIGLGVTIWLVWQTIGDIKKDVKGNPYAGLTRPRVYPESPLEGNDAARPQLFEFGDFACPACREMQPVVEKIFSQYGDRLAHVWKDFPVHPSLSKPAAVAARCAGRQNKFWPYHDWLFRQRDIKKTSFVAGAKDLGLDEAKFTACREDKKVLDYIERDFLEAQALGVGEIPAFVMGDNAWAGVISFEEFEKIVLEELGKL